MTTSCRFTWRSRALSGIWKSPEGLKGPLNDVEEARGGCLLVLRHNLLVFIIDDARELLSSSLFSSTAILRYLYFRRLASFPPVLPRVFCSCLLAKHDQSLFPVQPRDTPFYTLRYPWRGPGSSTASPFDDRANVWSCGWRLSWDHICAFVVCHKRWFFYRGLLTLFFKRNHIFVKLTLWY